MKRIAVVDNSRFRSMEEKRRVESACPQNRMGEKCVYFEGDMLRMDENVCNDMSIQICAKTAPHAIKAVRLPTAENNEPVFRYGKNSFGLFSLPIPLPGKVVGLVGRNGIGKTTALGILSGFTRPNLGMDSATEHQVLNRFKGSYLKEYFRALFEDELDISIKPQHPDSLAARLDGTVREVLVQADEKGIIHRMVEELDLGRILGTSIRSVSGGELQRVAIAMAMMRKADVYIFDEPSSFLDVKQRLRVSALIRELSEDGASVIVAEHDLIVLDYMADVIHVLFGEEGTYGIVSQPKSAKKGINQYIEGYLKEENVLIRKKPIKFVEGSPDRTSMTDTFVSWDNVERKSGIFTLKAEKGEIRQSESIGVLGENGIGKTSFIKLLAGIGMPDGGRIDGQVTVSYKPQYLYTDSHAYVSEVLRSIPDTSHLIELLELRKLADRRVGELSGGELQRLAIAMCLSRKADLYMLDEPSAFLDVEERLTVARLIKELLESRDISCVVVDHDLMFIEAFSQSLMVFAGTPAAEGVALGPFSKERGMNLFLEGLSITFRRDDETGRPRANDPDSVKDREQKSSGRYYYR